MDSKRRRPRLSLDLLKGFEAAARHLSFTRAAQELCLTQSAVSREIKTLEQQLGQPLFSRINRGLRLTDAGQVLHRAVGEALALIDRAIPLGRDVDLYTLYVLRAESAIALGDADVLVESAWDIAASIRRHLDAAEAAGAPVSPLEASMFHQNLTALVGELEKVPNGNRERASRVRASALVLLQRVEAAGSHAGST